VKETNQWPVARPGTTGSVAVTKSKCVAMVWESWAEELEQEANTRSSCVEYQEQLLRSWCLCSDPGMPSRFPLALPALPSCA
jgi:hypothetical protein